MSQSKNSASPAIRGTAYDITGEVKFINPNATDAREGIFADPISVDAIDFDIRDQDDTALRDYIQRAALKLKGYSAAEHRIENFKIGEIKSERYQRPAGVAGEHDVEDTFTPQ